VFGRKKSKVLKGQFSRLTLEDFKKEPYTYHSISSLRGDETFKEGGEKNGMSLERKETRG